MVLPWWAFIVYVLLHYRHQLIHSLALQVQDNWLFLFESQNPKKHFLLKFAKSLINLRVQWLTSKKNWFLPFSRTPIFQTRRTTKPSSSARRTGGNPKTNFPSSPYCPNWGGCNNAYTFINSTRFINSTTISGSSKCTRPITPYGTNGEQPTVAFLHKVGQWS